LLPAFLAGHPFPVGCSGLPCHCSIMAADR
jgi:hypothetical protein